MDTLDLSDLRARLIRQEETIIFALIERAQFSLNEPIYTVGGVALPGFDGCFSDYLLYETEKVHARVRRYTSPDEHPFSADLPDPILPPMAYPTVICRNNINVNAAIREVYRDEILPAICRAGVDQHFGSSATCDVACLQALSKRIHYGKFVAESKYREAQAYYAELIRARDSDQIMAALTNVEVESQLLHRVEAKAATYGRDVAAGGDSAAFKIQPARIAEIYARHIIPLTKEVEVAYLLARLDADNGS